MPVRDRPGTEGWDRRGGEFGDLTEVGSEVGMMVAALRTFSLSSEVAWIYSSRLSRLQRRISRERKKESIAEIPKGIVLYCTVLLGYTVLNNAATTDDYQIPTVWKQLRPAQSVRPQSATHSLEILTTV